MFSSKMSTVAALGIMALGLSACGTANLMTEYQWRWGPDPTMPASSIDGVLANQTMVIDYIARNAPLNSLGGTPQYYYEMAQWGFNVGRQDCETYMTVLFKLNRERGRNGSVITALGTAASAVVTASSRSASTLSILAAAFGLASALNDAYYTTYLFSEAPGLVSKKVKDLQDAYQESIAQAYLKTPPQNAHRQLMTAADAYNALQAYYQICLPDAIEGVLLERVATGKADASPPTATTTTTTTMTPTTKTTTTKTLAPTTAASNARTSSLK